MCHPKDTKGTFLLLQQQEVFKGHEDTFTNIPWHTVAAIIISGCTYMCGTEAGPCQGTAVAEILPKIYGHKSGQLSILVLAPTTEEGRIPAICLIHCSMEARAKAGCTSCLLCPCTLMLHFYLKGCQLLILCVCLQGIRSGLELEPDL